MHDSAYESYLGRRRDTGRLRSLRPAGPTAGGRIEVDGREVIDFSSNDDLDLSNHPLRIDRAREWAESWGVGSPLSRTTTLTRPPIS
jgi:8-amino-7-oxononanoate synthase